VPQYAQPNPQTGTALRARAREDAVTAKTVADLCVLALPRSVAGGSKTVADLCVLALPRYAWLRHARAIMSASSRADFFSLAIQSPWSAKARTPSTMPPVR